MRRPCLLAPKHFAKAYYHCVLRVVNREFCAAGEGSKEEGGRNSKSADTYAKCGISVMEPRGFVEEAFQANREKFGEARKDGSGPVRGLATGEGKLYNLRNLQKAVFS